MCKYLHGHFTHFSGLPGFHKATLHVLEGPICASSRNNSSVRCLNIFLNKIYCFLPLHAETKCLCKLRDLLCSPALAIPTTSLLNPRCKIQHYAGSRPNTMRVQDPRQMRAPLFVQSPLHLYTLGDPCS